MASIIPRLDVSKFRPSNCVDCNANVLTGTYDGEFVIVHIGDWCDGFRRRFSKPNATTAYNEKGDRVVPKK